AVAMKGMAVAIWGWLAVLVMGREMLVTVLRSYIEQQGVDFSAKMPGKLKMVFQCVAAVAALLALHYGSTGDGEASVPALISNTLLISIALTIIFTVYSGAGYVKSATRILRTNP
ncbi:MAG: CDP-alcohol phosphatidyltransferase family protein, partial [Pirellulaceae bacterium]